MNKEPTKRIGIKKKLFQREKIKKKMKQYW